MPPVFAASASSPRLPAWVKAYWVLPPPPERPHIADTPPVVGPTHLPLWMTTLKFVRFFSKKQWRTLYVGLSDYLMPIPKKQIDLPTSDCRDVEKNTVPRWLCIDTMWFFTAWESSALLSLELLLWELPPRTYRPSDGRSPSYPLDNLEISKGWEYKFFKFDVSRYSDILCNVPLCFQYILVDLCVPVIDRKSVGFRDYSVPCNNRDSTTHIYLRSRCIRRC